MLSLLIQFLPVAPVSLDHVKHRLKFGIQLDQSLEREREREEGVKDENIKTKKHLHEKAEAPVCAPHVLPFH